MNDIIVPSEVEAYQIMGMAGQVRGYNTTNAAEPIHTVANKLILLAERIKAERAVAAMQREGNEGICSVF